MTGRLSFLFGLLLVASAVSSSQDGEWQDDVTGNAEVMGVQSESDSPQVFVPVAPVVIVHSDDDGHDHSARNDDAAGQWVDDVSGNLLIMGQDPLSQDSSINNNAAAAESSDRKRRSPSKKSKKHKKGSRRELNSH